MFRAVKRLHIYRLLHKNTVAPWSSRQQVFPQLAEVWVIPYDSYGNIDPCQQDRETLAIG